MIVEKGDKLLVTHRRLFAEDQPRFFVGVVEEYEDGLAAVTGHSFVREPVRGDLVRKPDQRTKLVSIASGNVLVYLLPSATALEELRAEHGPDGSVVLTDGAGLCMDLTDRRHPHA